MNGLFLVLVPVQAVEALDSDRSTLARLGHALLACVLAAAVITAIVITRRRDFVHRTS
jgi:hypothetical protein